jgi:molybdopterin converting factor small subunit
MEIQFYGSIREKTALKKLVTEDKIKNISDLKSWLKGKYPDIDKYAYLIAINNMISLKNQSLKPSDIISIIPSFVGG